MNETPDYVIKWVTLLVIVPTLVVLAFHYLGI